MNGAQLTLWLPDSPVNRPVLRVSAEVRMMLDGSGRKSHASFAPASPLLSCLKTFLASSVWDSMTFSAIWTARATKARRVYIRLRRLERRMNGNGSSSWLTPRAIYGDHPGMTDTKHLTGQAIATQWPTPTVNGDYNRRGASPTSGDGLATAVKASAWPTPQARDWKGSSGRSMKGEEYDLPTAAQGKLNPDWVSQLMGYPDGWLDIPSSPTAGPPAPVKPNTHGKRRAPSRPATEHPDAPRS